MIKAPTVQIQDSSALRLISEEEARLGLRVYGLVPHKKGADRSQVGGMDKSTLGFPLDRGSSWAAPQKGRHQLRAHGNPNVNLDAEPQALKPM